MDRQQDSIRDRATWHSMRDALESEFAQRLVALAKEDFSHQIHPRGLEDYPALNEVKGEVHASLDRVRQVVEIELDRHFLMARAKKRGEDW